MLDFKTYIIWHNVTYNGAKCLIRDNWAEEYLNPNAKSTIFRSVTTRQEVT